MNKRFNDSRQMISEMKSMLKSKPEQRGLFEGLVYGDEDDESMMVDYNQPEDGQKRQDYDDLRYNCEETGMRKNNPLDENPEITKLITGIRVQTLNGLAKLADTPESTQYELLKKIFLLIDKAVEEKVNIEK